MLTREMSVAAAIAQLKKEVADRQAAAAILEALVTHRALPTSGIDSPPAEREGQRPSVAEAAVQILRTAGRAMHGSSELLPMLMADGYQIRANSLGSAILRTGQVVRTARGVFAFRDPGPGL